MECGTANCNSDNDFSILLSMKQVLHVISLHNLNSICCAFKDSTQNSAKIQDKISAVSCCWKSAKLSITDLVTNPCKNCKNWDESKRNLEDINIDIILTKKDKWRLQVARECEIETLKGSIYVASIFLV